MVSSKISEEEPTGLWDYYYYGFSPELLVNLQGGEAG